MGTYTRTYNFTNGTTAYGSQVAFEFDAVGTSCNNIVNAQIASGAAIADSKLAAITTAGKVLNSALAFTDQAQGDIAYFNGTQWVRLAAGTSGQFLKTQGASANPDWGAPFTSYDSGWFAWSANNGYNKTHNLGTIKFLATAFYSSAADGSADVAIISNQDRLNADLGGYQLKSITTTSIRLQMNDGIRVTTDAGERGDTITSGYARIILVAIP
jgi:hypothetical protein